MPENNFGYESMLEITTGFYPPDSQLNQLAKFMTDNEPQGIPAGYTYLGQFIDHDISLDSTAVERIPPWYLIPLSTVYNKRTLTLNLETIYGFEHTSGLDEPTRAELLAENSHTLLKLGDTVAANSVQRSFVGKDLPRRLGKPIAVIVDSRNDENLAVAQTQVAFMRFHNAVVKHLDEDDTTETFEKAREIVIKHYQWIVLHDYLPRIIKKSVLNDVINEGNRFYFPNPEIPFMPLEFSFGAFRFGHSMIRNSYNWNCIFNEDRHPSQASLKELAEQTGRGGLGGRNNLPSEWLINWNWFYPITGRTQPLRFNFASKINTKISSVLGRLPDNSGQPAREFNRNTSLPALDLYRGRALGLPSGQMAAKTILGTEDRVLKPEQIINLLPTNLKYVFSKETPLWFYLLAEAEIEENGQTLGEVGSRIIAETFVELIKLSTPSILSGGFQPHSDFFEGEKEFGMRELLRFVALSEKDPNDLEFDPLNPLKNEDACKG
jgi:hypothetical protein